MAEVPSSKLAVLHTNDDQLLGALDLRTFGLEISSDLERLVIPTLEQLGQQIASGALTQSDAMAELDRRHPEYRTARAHEKAHWFQTLGCSLVQAFAYSLGDRTSYILNTLREIPTTEAIKLPLVEWAKESSCPREIVRACEVCIRSWLADLALDGVRPPWAAKAIDAEVGDLFRSLPPPYWDRPEFRLGRRPLEEGSATAAEYIYQLREGLLSGTVADREIRSRGIEYSAAYEHVAAAVPKSSVLGCVQSLAVCADMALHPLLPLEGWPWLQAMAKEIPAEDLLPGYRFVRLLSLLTKARGVDLESKDEVGGYLDLEAQKELGWASSIDSSRRASELLAKVIEATIRQAGLADFPELVEAGFMPLDKVKLALELRCEKPWALVPPVDSDEVNQRRININGFVGSEISPVSEVVQAGVWAAWTAHFVAGQVWRIRDPACALHHCAGLLNEVLDNCHLASTGLCHDGGGYDLRVGSFLRCSVTDDVLRPILGAGWQSRVQFVGWR
jgi:hypothetical protein